MNAEDTENSSIDNSNNNPEQPTSDSPEDQIKLLEEKLAEAQAQVLYVKAEGENIMKTFGVEPEDLTLGAFDAGSFSAKPKAKDGALNTAQWEGFNKIHPNAGSALVIPVSSTTRTISLADINPSQTEINNIINQKTKACK